MGTEATRLAKCGGDRSPRRARRWCCLHTPTTGGVYRHTKPPARRGASLAMVRGTQADKRGRGPCLGAVAPAPAQGWPRGVINGRRGFSPEHINAEPLYRTRRAGYRGRADKKCPNRSPLIAFARHGKLDVVAISDVGVFRHAATERGGGGGLRTAIGKGGCGSPRALMYRPSVARGRGQRAGRSR